MTTPLRILLIEDSEDDTFLLLRELGKGPYSIEHQRVDTLPDTRKALRERHWDLIISDYNLPGFSALDAIAEVRALKLDIPVIIVSGAIGEDIAVEAMHAGAHDYIMKDNLKRLNPAVERELKELEVHRQRRQAEEALRHSEHRFRQLAETIEEVFWLVDCRERRMVYVSPGYEKLWECSPQPLHDHLERFLDAVHPEDYARVQALLERGWEQFTADYRIQRPDGSVRWIYTRSFPVRSSDGTLERVAGLSVDITDRKEQESTLTKMVRALEQTADSVMITDRDGLIEYVNAACENMTGYSREEMLGKKPNFLSSGLHEKDFFRQLWRSVSNGLPFSEIFVNRRKDGEFYFESKTIAPVRDERGDVTHFVSTGKDITDRLRRQDSLHRMLNYDALTGLASRALFLDKLNQAILQARRTERPLGILSVGLELNELFGDSGDDKLKDQLIRAIGQRLRETVQEGALLGRLDQDEFAVIDTRCETAEQMEATAQRLVDAFEEPLGVGGYELFLAPSIGISIYPDNGESARELFDNATCAMGQVRGGGRDRYKFYDVQSCRKGASARFS